MRLEFLTIHKFTGSYTFFTQFFNVNLLHFSQVQEWLYMDGEDATASEFQERLDMLKAKGDPIFFR